MCGGFAACRRVCVESTALALAARLWGIRVAPGPSTQSAFQTPCPHQVNLDFGELYLFCHPLLRLSILDVPTGELPRNMLLAVDRKLVQSVVPGTRVTVMGIYSIYQANNSSVQKGAVAVRQPYIRVVGIEQATELNSGGPTSFTMDEIGLMGIKLELQWCQRGLSYRDNLIHNRNFLQVAMEDLDSFDAELSEKIYKVPPDFLPLFESAAAEVLAGVRSKVVGEMGEMEEPTTGEVQVLLFSKENSISMQSLGADFSSKLVKIFRITIAASRTKAKATYVTLLYRNCKNVKSVPCCPRLGGAIMPCSCDHVPQPGEEPCPIDPWVVIPNKSKYVDQ